MTLFDVNKINAPPEHGTWIIFPRQNRRFCRYMGQQGSEKARVLSILYTVLLKGILKKFPTLLSSKKLFLYINQLNASVALI